MTALYMLKFNKKPLNKCKQIYKLNAVHKVSINIMVVAWSAAECGRGPAERCQNDGMTSQLATRRLRGRWRTEAVVEAGAPEVSDRFARPSSSYKCLSLLAAGAQSVSLATVVALRRNA